MTGMEKGIDLPESPNAVSRKIPCWDNAALLQLLLCTDGFSSSLLPTAVLSPHPVFSFGSAALSLHFSLSCSAWCGAAAELRELALTGMGLSRKVQTFLSTISIKHSWDWDSCSWVWLQKQAQVFKCSLCSQSKCFTPLVLVCKPNKAAVSTGSVSTASDGLCLSLGWNCS